MAESDFSNYDFIDFGCSKGGSIEFARKAFGVERGVGIDISPTKVEAAKAAGFDAILADARRLALYPGAVSFVTLVDFLEHVPGWEDAKICIQSAAEVARDFVFIRQPWFDSDGYLLSQGFKLYWSDWQGHPNAMTSLEFHCILARISRISRFKIYGRDPVKDSDDPSIHSLASPVDQHAWEAGRHPPKAKATFTYPVFKQIVCIAELDGGTMRLEDIEAKVPWHATLFDSGER